MGSIFTRITFKHFPPCMNLIPIVEGSPQKGPSQCDQSRLATKKEEKGLKSRVKWEVGKTTKNGIENTSQN